MSQPDTTIQTHTQCHMIKLSEHTVLVTLWWNHSSHVLTFMYFNKWSHLSQKHSFLWTSMANKDNDNQTWQDTPRKWAGKESKWSTKHIQATEHKSGNIYIVNEQVDFRGLPRKCTSSKKMCWMNIVESHRLWRHLLPTFVLWPQSLKPSSPHQNSWQSPKDP